MAMSQVFRLTAVRRRSSRTSTVYLRLSFATHSCSCKVAVGLLTREVFSAYISALVVQQQLVLFCLVPVHYKGLPACLVLLVILIKELVVVPAERCMQISSLAYVACTGSGYGWGASEVYWYV